MLKKNVTKNDNDITDHLRNSILEDMLILKESDWRRGLRVQQLNRMRSEAHENKLQLAIDLKRETQIDNLRMQPIMESLRSGLKHDLRALKSKNSQWRRLYKSMDHFETLLDRSDYITARQIKDCQRHLVLVVSMLEGCRDPRVDAVNKRANEKLRIIRKEALVDLADILNEARAKEDDENEEDEARHHRLVEIALFNAMGAGAGAGAGASADVSASASTSTKKEVRTMESSKEEQQLLADARAYLARHLIRATEAHRSAVHGSLNNEKATANDLHNMLLSFRQARLKGNMEKDSNLAQGMAAAKKQKSIHMKTSYLALKRALGLKKDIVKVRSFRHALSRQEGGGDAAPTGMVSEWTYDSTSDTYTYPRGHIEMATLQGLHLGAAKYVGLSRYEMERRKTEEDQGAQDRAQENKRKERREGKSSQEDEEKEKEKEKETSSKMTFIGRDLSDANKITRGGEVGLNKNDGTLQWKFQIDGTSSISSLRIKALSSTTGRNQIIWSVRGGKLKDESKGESSGSLKVLATAVPKTLTKRLGSSSFVDVTKHVVGWDWFVVEAIITTRAGGGKEEEPHVEDVQLFRSIENVLNKPQLSIQLGLSLCSEEVDSNAIAGNGEMLRVLAECESHGVSRLGADARSLIDRAMSLISRSQKK